MAVTSNRRQRDPCLSAAFIRSSRAQSAKSTSSMKRAGLSETSAPCTAASQRLHCALCTEGEAAFLSAHVTRPVPLAPTTEDSCSLCVPKHRDPSLVMKHGVTPGTASRHDVQDVSGRAGSDSR